MNFNLEYITDYIDRKINENEEFIKITFYELVAEEELSKEQVSIFLEYSKIRLRNLNYTIYQEGDTYTYKGKSEKIENNIFYIAIKEKR